MTTPMRTTTTNQPPPWAVPYMQDYLKRAQDVANVQYTPSPTQYSGPNNYLTNAWNAVSNRATQGSPLVSAAQNGLTDYLQGGPQNNQILNRSIRNAQGDLTRAWNTVEKPAWDTAMQRSGSFGNTGIMEANTNAQSELQRNLGRISTDMRQGATNQWLGALGQVPGLANQDYIDAGQLMNVGNQAQNFTDRGNAQNYQWWQEAQNYPINRLNVLGNALGMNTGGTSTTTQPGVSPWSSVLGGAMTGAGLFDMLFRG